MRRPGLRLRLVLFLIACAARALAQEALDDQDPVDLDWVPAWDTPFWPAPSGAALEVALGHRRHPGSGEPGADIGSGDYVVALLTLPLGARPRASPAAQAGEGEEPAHGADSSPGGERAQRARPPPKLAQPPNAPSPIDDGARRAVPPEEALERGEPAPPGASEGPAGPAPTEVPSGGDGERPAEAARFEAVRLRAVPLELLEDAIERAERAAGYDRALRRLASIGQRSRWSGLAPELRLRGATGIDQTRSIDSAGLVPSDETVRDASDSLVEVRLTFHLERLLHSGQEVALERARQQLLAERAELRALVGQELLTYVRARRRAQDELLEAEEREKVEVSLERARLALYLLTDGWFRGEETLRAYTGARAP